MERKFELNWLMDFYAQLLTQRQREILTLHLSEDLSYGEIASELNITRQAAADAVRSAGEQLQEYERKLGLQKRHVTLRDALEGIKAAIQEGQGAQALAQVNALIDRLDEEDDHAL